MCRWLAYTGSPILPDKALYSPAHSLIDQSLHSRLSAEATNGDGLASAGTANRPSRASSGASSPPGTMRIFVTSPPTSVPGTYPRCAGSIRSGI